MTNTLVFVIAFELFIFALGILVGNGLNTRAQDDRSRGQAAVQRYLNARSRALDKKAKRLAAREDELRSRYLEQAGLTVINHDEQKEVPTKDQQPPRQPRRPARWQ